jgi:UDP-glucose-4-epimerase GalE
MASVGVKQIVFSSTCATYGIPSTIPIVESEPQKPVNPYGESKLFIERALYWQGMANNCRWMALRYFNAAGADPDGELGEDHDPETHLIPLAIGTLLGKAAELQVMGTDYPTPDGTAIRDYVHVTDLADAHVRALRYLQEGGQSTALNVGTGNGHSVREVIKTVERVTGGQVNARNAPRRAGDPAVLVAAPGRVQKVLDWQPKFSSLDTIVETAHQWHHSHDSVSREAARFVAAT